jgi:Fe-S cluster biogenesis protein NfuA
MVISNDSEQEIQSAFSNELTPLVKQHGDPLDYGDIKTAEQILVSFWIRKFRY